MAGSRLERYDSKTTVGPVALPETKAGAVGASLRSEASDWDQIGRAAGAVGARALEVVKDQSIERGSQDAALHTFTRGEDGKLKLPDTMERITAYGASFAKSLENRYVTETAIGISENAGKLRLANRFNPDGFKEGWASYSDGLVEGVDPAVRDRVRLRASEVGLQHHQALADEKFTRDWNDAKQVHVKEAQVLGDDLYRAGVLGGDTTVLRARVADSIRRGRESGYYSQSDVDTLNSQADTQQALGGLMRQAKELNFEAEPERALQIGLRLSQEFMNDPPEQFRHLGSEARNRIANFYEAVIRQEYQTATTMREFGERTARFAQDRVIAGLMLGEMTPSPEWQAAIDAAPNGGGAEVTRAYLAAQSRAREEDQRQSGDMISGLLRDMERTGVLTGPEVDEMVLREASPQHAYTYFNYKNSELARRAAEANKGMTAMQVALTQAQMGLPAPDSKETRDGLNLVYQGPDGRPLDTGTPEGQAQLTQILRRFQQPPQFAVNYLEGALTNASPDAPEVLARGVEAYKIMRQFPAAMGALKPATIEAYESLISVTDGGTPSRQAVTNIINNRQRAATGLDEWWGKLGNEKEQREWLDKKLEDATETLSLGGGILPWPGFTPRDIPAEMRADIRRNMQGLAQQGMTTHDLAFKTAYENVSRAQWGASSIGMQTDPSASAGPDGKRMVRLPPEKYAVAGSTAYMETEVRELLGNVHPGFPSAEELTWGTDIKLLPRTDATVADPRYVVAVRQPDGTFDFAVDANNRQIEYNPTKGMRTEHDRLANARVDAAANSKDDFWLGLLDRGLRAATGKPQTAVPSMLNTNVRQLVDAEAARAGLDPIIFQRLVRTESSFRIDALGPVTRSGERAEGPTQVMPSTGKDPGYGVQPLQNDSWQEKVRFGADYLAAMQRLFNGDLRLAAAAYNWGPGYVQEWVKAGGTWDKPLNMPAETRSYVRKVVG